VLGAFLEGWRRVINAPALTIGILVATFLCALPMALVMKDSMERHLGDSLEADVAMSGWNTTWAVEFAGHSPGLASTFTHEILGFGGTMAIVSRLFDNVQLTRELQLAVAVYIGLWIFLSGGVLDRLARGRPVRVAAFFAACGVYFMRFLRLAVVMGTVYCVLFAWVHPFLFGTVYDRLTRDMTEERDAIVLRGALYLIFALALMLASMVADFAKVRAVVEDRHSMLGALGASLRFIRRRFFRVSGLYVLNVIALLVILRLWLQVAPSAAAASWLALLIGQVYILMRVWAKLAFMASETVYFQGELAHAGYTAAPDPVWPDSPAAEAIGTFPGS